MGNRKQSQPGWITLDFVLALLGPSVLVLAGIVVGAALEHRGFLSHLWRPLW